jgi:hypothetical protein
MTADTTASASSDRKSLQRSRAARCGLERGPGGRLLQTVFGAVSVLANMS